MLRLLALAALVVVAGGGWTGARAAPPRRGRHGRDGVARSRAS